MNKKYKLIVMVIIKIDYSSIFVSRISINRGGKEYVRCIFLVEYL